MKVENWELSKVIPYENNPRDNDEAAEYVAKSIKEFGFQQPIVVDKNGIIIVGHTRWKAAQQLGLDEVPVIIADELTENQADAYRLADNKVAEYSLWDFGKLNIELENIGWQDIDMSDFGFKLDDELELPDELDDNETRDSITLNVRFDSYDDYTCCIDEIKELIEGHGSISVKMSDETNKSE